MQHWPVLLYVYFSRMCFFPELAFLSVSPELRLAKGGFKKRFFQQKTTRMSPFCQLGLQMHLFGVVLQLGSTKPNYSIRETAETVKRACEQYFPL